MTRLIELAKELLAAEPGNAQDTAEQALKAWLTDPDHFATEEEIALARRRYIEGSCTDIEIDDGALASRADDGTWVQAWVWLPHPSGEGE